MTEAACNQIIDFMKGSNCDVQSISDVLTVKNSARDIAFSENCRFVSQFNLLEILDEFQVCRAMRFRKPLELANDERRDHGSIFRQLMLPPADRQVATEWLTIIEISTNNRRFEVSA